MRQATASKRPDAGRSISRRTANEYDKVFTYVPGPVAFESDPAPAHLLLPLYQNNVLYGHSYGGEVSTRWAVTDSWQLSAGYSRLRGAVTAHQQFGSQGSADTVASALRSGPAAWTAVQRGRLLHGSYPVAAERCRHASRSYLRVDTSLNWRLRPNVELVVRGQNLLDSRHAEFGSFKTSTLGEIPRTMMTGLTWAF